MANRRSHNMEAPAYARELRLVVIFLKGTGISNPAHLRVPLKHLSCSHPAYRNPDREQIRNLRGTLESGKNVDGAMEIVRTIA